MRFSPAQDNITLYEDGFDKDILGREKPSKALSDLVERFSDPLVIALNGNWGTGKTHFLRRWVGAHRKQNDGKALTVYFDAYANDYLDDPLIAITSTLTARLPRAPRAKVKKVKEAAGRLIKPAARIGLSIATQGLSNIVEGAVQAGVKQTSEEAGKAIDIFWKEAEGRRRAMEEFREALTSLQMTTGDDQETAIVIVIDELDRCRPDYALQLLEVIKHFFNVDWVHFILGTNINALENSVRARYGSGIDASAYLKKFINLQLHLPQVSGARSSKSALETYARHVFETHEIPSSISESLLTHILAVNRKNPISLRDVEQISSRTILLPNDILKKKLYEGFKEIAITLIVSERIRPDLFPLFLDCTISDQQIMQYYGIDSENLKERVGGNYNESFDPSASLNYSMWRYLAGRTDELDDNSTTHLSQLFGTFGLRGARSREVPMNVQRDWLDLFER